MGLTNPITKYWNTNWKPTNMHLTKRFQFMQYNVVKEETLRSNILKLQDRK